MSSLSAKPGYNEALAQKDALKAQLDALLDQRDAAAREFGIESQQAQQYQQQASALSPQYQAAIDRLQEIITSPSPDLASPTLTTGQSQSTPAPNPRDDGPQQAPTSGGVGAGTSPNASDSRGPDNTPPPSRSTTQQDINTTFASQAISPRPNVLDQYASYTYAIAWWLLTPEQYNNLGSGRARAPVPNTANWNLLIQSGGISTAGRNAAFPDDFYFDDLEIETVLAGKGTGMSNNATSIRFKVVEPNGLTLVERLFQAVSTAYRNPSPAAGVATGFAAIGDEDAQQVPFRQQIPNYAAAQYCLTIEFYGYDSQGNLVAPATGNSGTGPQAVIKKYYPFVLKNITFRTVDNQVEYMIEAAPVPYDTGTGQARGTIPFNFGLAGTTVSQLLQGGPLPVSVATNNDERSSPAPNVGIDALIDAGIAQDTNRAQVDANGNFTGASGNNPFTVVAP
jgi:hypothetical protein